MGFFARTMGEISEFLRLEDDREEYARHETGILANLDGKRFRKMKSDDRSALERGRTDVLRC